MPESVAILGAGSWGMAVSHLLCQAGGRVTLWEPIAAEYARLAKSRTNSDKLKSFRLDDAIVLSDDLQEAITDCTVVVLALPSQHLRSVLRQVKTELAGVKALVNLAKGIENGSLLRMSEVISDATGLPPERIVTLSGPSHAEEVVLDMPTTVVAASVSERSAAMVQEMFSVGHFRVYKSDDIIGVELGGALKNIIAIAAGIADGLNMGDNTKGALITRGLAEITRLGLAAGARAETFAGLSGIGDLVTTCTSRHSRNRFVGEHIARGENLDDIVAGMNMIAEGIETTRSGFQLARKFGVEMPITEEVHQVLFDGKSAAAAVSNLMERKLRTELWQ